MSWFSRFFSSSSNRFRGDPPSPGAPFFAIGDVHGRNDLLIPLLDRLVAYDAPIILVGDYVDRGEDSAGVLRTLYERSKSENLICLRGNHEDMMMRFLENPEKYGQRWLRFGGLQTLASFGIGGVTERSQTADLIDARNELSTAMGDLIDWLEQLPHYWQSGNVAVVHAGADPMLPLADQTDRVLAWGHKDFDSVARPDGSWIVHGHVIVPTAIIENGRAAIDTGAYATGQLTAVHVTDGVITPVD